MKKYRACSALLLFFVGGVYAGCDFNTSNYLDELKNPSHIKSINIEIPDSKKWSKNLLKIVLDRSANINPKHRDKFDSNIIVVYDFGSCIYSGRTRISGDWKDHVQLTNGIINASLDIQLYDGNILNAVRFKLLIPETRNSMNEIMGSIILNRLGYITPETFLVKANVNNYKGIYLFQENAAKEMLERNLKREGPIFEGNEQLLWSFKDYKTMELEDISLSRLTNDNWANKGPISTKIALQSFLKLQNVYLEYAQNNQRQANYYLNSNFINYGFILIAMNGSHALYPHNMKFYFNALNQDFEPIYYDGDLRLDLQIAIGSLKRDVEIDTFISNIKPSIVEKYVLNLKAMLDSVDYMNKFLDRVHDKKFGESFYKTSIENILGNIKILTSEDSFAKNKYVQLDNIKVQTFKNYLERVTSRNINNFEIYNDIKLFDDGFQIRKYGTKDDYYSITQEDLVKIMSKNKFDGKRSELVLLNPIIEDYGVVVSKFLDWDILHSPDIKIYKDTTNFILTFEQGNPAGWVIIKNATIDNWSIKFIGAKALYNQVSQDAQRFNTFGLTGCLNIFNSIVKNISLDVKNGQCEDSLNIINSSGSLKFLKIYNAYADALDIDFSDISILDLKIDTAGNDCYDVSGGSYAIQNAKLSNCGDKGFSVGEMSRFVLNDGYINSANIGISTKDFSTSQIDKLETINLNICIEAFQKKQEFGGAIVTVNNILKCNADNSIGSNSSLYLN
jgi:hypothetical protein